MTTPCPHCPARLPVTFDTDGAGHVVESVERCDCEGARWRRGECVELGCTVSGLRRGQRLGKKRCPKHWREHERRRKRRYERERYHEDPEYRALIHRKFRQRYHGSPRFRLERIRYCREYRRLESEAA